MHPLGSDVNPKQQLGAGVKTCGVEAGFRVCVKTRHSLLSGFAAPLCGKALPFRQGAKASFFVVSCPWHGKAQPSRTAERRSRCFSHALFSLAFAGLTQIGNSKIHT